MDCGNFFSGDLTANNVPGESSPPLSPITVKSLINFLSQCRQKNNIVSKNIMKTSKYTKILALNPNPSSKSLNKNIQRIFQKEAVSGEQHP